MGRLLGQASAPRTPRASWKQARIAPTYLSAHE